MMLHYCQLWGEGSLLAVNHLSVHAAENKTEKATGYIIA